jgi:hypothetical protein
MVCVRNRVSFSSRGRKLSCGSSVGVVRAHQVCAQMPMGDPFRSSASAETTCIPERADEPGRPPNRHRGCGDCPAVRARSRRRQRRQSRVKRTPSRLPQTLLRRPRHWSRRRSTRGGRQFRARAAVEDLGDRARWPCGNSGSDLHDTASAALVIGRDVSKRFLRPTGPATLNWHTGPTTTISRKFPSFREK